MKKSLFQIISEYSLRICVFQIGEYKRGPFARYLIRLLKKHYDLSDKNIPLNSGVLDGFIQVLENLGGMRFLKTSIDGKAQIDYMLLSYENVRKKIEEHGGKWIEIDIKPSESLSVYQTSPDPQENAHYAHVIFADHETPQWKAFFDQVLCKIGWEKAAIEFPDKTREVLITQHLKRRPPPNHKACFLRCHSPGRSYGMDKKYIAKHLGAKKDLCLFDYRGTHFSTGEASEGGYYLDVETIFNELIHTYGYQPHQIWSTGFCLGGAVAAYLKAKYHALGIHYVGENTFTSLVSVINHQIWPARQMGKVAMDGIKSFDPSIIHQVQQDEFNTLEKFNKMTPEKKEAISIFINTDADTILPQDSGEKLFLAASKSGKAFQITHHSQGHSNPHADNVFDEERVWNEYLDIISNSNSLINRSL